MSEMVASTELLNAYNMSENQRNQWLGLLADQNIPHFIYRLNSFSEYNSNQSAGVSAARRMVSSAYDRNIRVSIDFHTWYTTWDKYLRSSTQNQTRYITYVTNTINALDDLPVQSYMVLNEPQARSASASENSFILAIIEAAKGATKKPVSVRFMGSASPTTGHYSNAIDNACDFLCRNMYWINGYYDPRNYNSNAENTMLNALNTAHNTGKECWITEFGAHKSDRERQRSYVEAVISWARQKGFDAVYCWASQPTQSGEDYNIFGGMTPYEAFYELGGGSVPPPPPECSIDVDCVSLYGEGYVCRDGKCVKENGGADGSGLLLVGLLFSLLLMVLLVGESGD